MDILEICAGVNGDIVDVIFGNIEEILGVEKDLSGYLADLPDVSCSMLLLAPIISFVAQVTFPPLPMLTMLPGLLRMKSFPGYLIF